jgi:hypothetical protein
MKFLVLASLLSLSTYFTASVEAKEVVIISDLDETLRMANIEKKVKAASKLIVGVKPYEGLVSIFQDLKKSNTQISFYYLSNSYPFLYSGKNWTKKYGLPQGVVLQRSLKDKSDSFKPRKLKEIAAKHPGASLLLFGDNVEHDPKFYSDFLNETRRPDTRIFIRDARLVFPTDPDITFFQTDAQITDDLEITEATTQKIKELPFFKLVPKFLIKNLKNRLVKACEAAKKVSCKEEAEEKVLDVIEEIRP